VRQASFHRKTNETDIEVVLKLEGSGAYDIQTPLPFLTHMIEQLARHSLFDLTVRMTGDVHIDGHHTTEDLAITLGQAVQQALGEKRNIVRYGHAMLPMDEACVSCALDLSGRTYFNWMIDIPKAKVGEFDSELAEVFFEGFARGAQCNLHMIKHCGTNLHHIIEISFKALAKALRMAVAIDPQGQGIPSTKGVL